MPGTVAAIPDVLLPECALFVDGRASAYVTSCMDVVVVGAGVYGAAVGEALVRRGAAVTVVDAGTPAGGTSGTTFSWLNAGGKQPKAYHELNVAGMAAHRRLAAQVPDGEWYHAGGNLEWAADPAGLAALRTRVAGALEWGYPVHWLGAAQVRDLEPDIDPGALPDDIAYFPDEAWLDPAPLVGHLLRRVEVVSGDAVAGIDMSAGLVRLASGRKLAAGAVVNCAGPRAAEVAAMVGLELPMRSTRGVLVWTAPAAVTVRRVVHAPGVNLRPAGGGRLLLHSPEVDGRVHTDGFGDPAVDPDAVGELLRAAAAVYPRAGPLRVESVREADRPIPGDGLPVLGRSVDVPNFHLAVSHSGATLCLHAGDLVAAEVVGEDVSAALAPYRLERFMQ
jgi:glycine/D-amino acid oxidase-like deaminating enzyme